MDAESTRKEFMQYKGGTIMAYFKCEICGEVFEADSKETAVCPKCKATGDKLKELKNK